MAVPSLTVGEHRQIHPLQDADSAPRALVLCSSPPLQWDEAAANQANGAQRN